MKGFIEVSVDTGGKPQRRLIGTGHIITVHASTVGGAILSVPHAVGTQTITTYDSYDEIVAKIEEAQS